MSKVKLLTEELLDEIERVDTRSEFVMGPAHALMRADRRIKALVPAARLAREAVELLRELRLLYQPCRVGWNPQAQPRGHMEMEEQGVAARVLALLDRVEVSE